MNASKNGSKSLDVMVGLELMGFCVVQHRNPILGSQPILIKVEEFRKERHELLPKDPGEKGQLVRVHPAIQPWSQSSAHAVEVLLAMQNDGWSYLCTNSHVSGPQQHHCLFWNPEQPRPNPMTTSEHFSVAVCVAALRAKGVFQARIQRAIEEGTT